MTRQPTNFRLASRRSVGCALGLLLALAVRTPAAHADAAVYPTPEAAADAFKAALGQDDGSGLEALFGAEHRDELVGGDPAGARQTVASLRQAANVALKVAPDGVDRATLLVGARGWPMPIPLVKGAAGWSFDVDEGMEEITDRRIGRNELSAIETSHAYVDAQMEYASADRNGDQVLEYAQRIESTPGKHDGLYWVDESGDDPSPFGPFIAGAEEYLGYRKAGEPFHGYRFRILTAQGAKPPGGKYGYVINGHMIAGFALVAWPADYGDSGIMTFVVNQQGKVFQKDLGPDTAKLVAAMKEYDPGDGWTEADAPTGIAGP